MHSPPLSILFLSIGAGAVFQVAYEIGRKLVWGGTALRQRPLFAFGGVLAGMLVLYITGLRSSSSRLRGVRRDSGRAHHAAGCTRSSASRAVLFPSSTSTKYSSSAPTMKNPITARIAGRIV